MTTGLPLRFTDHVPQFERGRRVNNTFEILTIDPVPFGMVLIPGDQAKGMAPFYLGETEVTWAMFKGWALHTDLEDLSDAYDLQEQGLRPSHYGEFAFAEFDTPQRPAVGLNRHTAEMFCAWLSEQTGRRYRLPTNAEWELAARLGGAFPDGPGARLARGTFLENSDRNANDPFYHPEEITEELYSSRYYCYPSHVANHPPDAMGLYDMHGNAAEWVSDLDEGRPFVRGGHFHLPVEAYEPGWRGVEDQRVWNEYYPQLPYTKYWYMNHYHQGFRLVCEPENLPADPGEPLLLPRAFRDEVPYRTMTDEQWAEQFGGILPDAPWSTLSRGPDWPPPFDMVLIPGDEANGIEPFYMQTTEVTWDMFGNWFAGRGLGDDAFEQWRGYDFHPSLYWRSEMAEMGLGDRPAVGMSRRAAELFCAWLSEETGRTYRLPTDAEWRHALAVGGGMPANREALLKQASLHDNGRFKSGGVEVLRVTYPVGGLEPNKSGLHDLLGNAAEWVTDTGDGRFVRGGHYLLPAAELTADWRGVEDLSVWNATAPQQYPEDPGVLRDAPFIGFRLVCEVGE